MDILSLKAVVIGLILLGSLIYSALMVLRLHKAFNTKLQEQKLQAAQELKAKIAEITEQMAEDIRGPLKALTNLSHLSHEMDTDKKELLQVAVTRIQRITEELLKNSQGEPKESEKSDLLAITQNLFKEFKFTHNAAKWSFHNHVQSGNLKVAIEEIKLQRLVSSLLHKSLETLPDREAIIDLTLLERADHFILQIMDNNSALETEALVQPASEEISLVDAKKMMESLGGQLQVRAREAVGTQMILIFPKEFGGAESAAL